MVKKVIVANFNVPDSQGDVFLPGSVKNLDEKVWLTKNFDHSQKPLGKVTVKEEGQSLVADVPAGLIDLYPAIGFQVISSNRNEEGIREITEMKIITVSLCDSPNADPTIKKISDQI